MAWSARCEALRLPVSTTWAWLNLGTFSMHVASSSKLCGFAASALAAALGVVVSACKLR